MDHIVCLDTKSREIENLLLGHKSMIIRGAESRRLPHGGVNEGDTLYFVNCSCEEEIMARGIVSSVFSSDMLTEEESFETIIRNQDKLQLPDNQFEKIAGKQYLLLIGVDNMERLTPFRFNKSLFPEMEDWIIVGKIEEYILS
jgi:hypothetical protein